MKNVLIRKKSPSGNDPAAVLNDYIRVSNPGVWLLLLSAALLLFGTILWSRFAWIESTVPGIVCVDDGRALCRVEDPAADRSARACAL